MNGMDHQFSSPARPGFWAPQTSVSNFCEVDYEFSHYIAEFVNTISNLAYVWQGVVTLPPHLRGGGKEWQVWKWPVENLALLLVGLGSGAFHATLLHEMQVLDESGMYALVGALDFQLWGSGMSEGVRLLFGTVLGGVIVGVIVWNAVGDGDGKSSVVVHLVLFIALLTALWPKVLYMIRQGRNSRRAQGQNGKDEVAKRQMWIFRMGVVFFFSGFGLWLVDGFFCYDLRALRAMVGIPACCILELHGWWHFLTALGAGNFIRVVRDLASTSETAVNGHANGHFKAS